MRPINLIPLKVSHLDGSYDIPNPLSIKEVSPNVFEVKATKGTIGWDGPLQTVILTMSERDSETFRKRYMNK